MSSEGLEGLLPRASVLLQLGVSSFLAFGPFIVAVVLSFAAIYAVFGDNFIHTGRPSPSPPPYYDAEELLREPSYDPMVPL